MRRHHRSVVVLHENLAGERRQKMDVRGGRNRTGEVRHDSDFVRVAHRHDLQHLGDAADVRERRAGVVDIAIFDQRLELRSLTPFFAGREWHGRQHPKLWNLGPELFFPHWILYQERPERLDQAADLERFMEVELLMDVDRPVAVRSNAVEDLHMIAIRIAIARMRARESKY